MQCTMDHTVGAQYMRCTMIINWHLEKSVLHAWNIWLSHRGGTQGEERQGLSSVMPGEGEGRHESPASFSLTGVQSAAGS